jgi:transcriptional regulator with XRE-family HTH domain
MNRTLAPLEPDDQPRSESQDGRSAQAPRVRTTRARIDDRGMRADPGDLGRRVVDRRYELGMTRADLAERAGMPVAFVEYVETQPAEPGTSTLRRLAAALETSPRILLGAGRNRPPGWAGVVRPSRQRELTPQECWDLIAPGGVGRIAAVTEDGLVVLPMNFTVDAHSVLVRTSSQGMLARLDDATENAFQVDRVDEAVGEGWSVLLVGGIHRVDEVPGSAETHGPQPWVGVNDLLLRFRPRRVTGRRIDAA